MFYDIVINYFLSNIGKRWMYPLQHKLDDNYSIIFMWDTRTSFFIVYSR